MISLGDNVHIASGVKFINHDVIYLMFRYMYNDNNLQINKGEITIGNNVFIGSNTIILYNTKIGDNVIIGAGSIVTKDIPSNSVAVGTPCKVIGSFEDYSKKVRKKF